MRRLSDTLAHLSAIRRTVKPGAGETGPSGRLAPLTDFGANPGNLAARLHVPEGLRAGAALVVVLHGCTQSAESYDRGAGWTALADASNFAVLYPEQQRANNSHLCFNWFEPADIRRDTGEATSIREMIAKTVALHRIDPSRIFITGLSAGGAMTATMLALYPEVFAGGAIIAGLPHGVASGVPQALERMRGQGVPSAATLTDLVRKASSHDGPWPRVQVWHGTADAVVVPANGEALLAQWRPLHGLPAAPDRQESIGPHLRRIWTNKAGEPVLEHYAIRGLGHGAPLETTGPQGLGTPGPHMLEAGLSSTRRIAESWNIAAATARTAAPAKAIDPAASQPGRIIENALRAAGLMR